MSTTAPTTRATTTTTTTTETRPGNDMRHQRRRKMIGQDKIRRNSIALFVYFMTYVLRIVSNMILLYVYYGKSNGGNETIWISLVDFIFLVRRFFLRVLQMLGSLGVATREGRVRNENTFHDSYRRIASLVGSLGCIASLLSIFPGENNQCIRNYAQHFSSGLILTCVR